MKNVAVGILSSIVTFASFAGYAMYKGHKSKVHIYMDFGEKDQEAEKNFIDIWKENKEI